MKFRHNFCGVIHDPAFYPRNLWITLLIACRFDARAPDTLDLFLFAQKMSKINKALINKKKSYATSLQLVHI
ncbi:MAG: hypothetical protein CMM59_13595 [Rhodospirillaceae bacterium]|nr:hypothetical protein [Rhodospirillaceae bacterium]